MMRLALLAFATLPWVTSSSCLFAQQPGFIRFPITASEAPANAARHIRRQNSVALVNRRRGFFYTIDLLIGTPGQNVTVSFDTGSWELWVNPSCNKSAEPETCESFPQFTDSTTLVDKDRVDEINYGAGYAKINYVHDYVSVGGARIKEQIFGIAYDTATVDYAVLGVGPWPLSWNSPYPLVLDSLVSQGHMQSRAFSLDLRSIGKPEGAVIFGGVDTKKYAGRLEKRPIASGPDGSKRYWIYLDGLSVTRENGSVVPVFDKPNGLLALLDSGTGVTLLPPAMVAEILKAFPSATKDPEFSDDYIVNCSVASLAGTVSFKFGSTTIKVPYDDFVWKHPQHNKCLLGVSPSDSFFVLGDTFLRSAYAVYDMDNRNIYLASSADCGSKLVAIEKGSGKIESLVGECGFNITQMSTVASPTWTNTTGGGIGPLYKTLSSSERPSTLSFSSTVSSAAGSTSVTER